MHSVKLRLSKLVYYHNARKLPSVKQCDAKGVVVYFAKIALTLLRTFSYDPHFISFTVPARTLI